MNEKSAVFIAQSVKAMRDNLPAILESVVLEARIRKAKYDALTKEGFTPAQALEICKAPF